MSYARTGFGVVSASALNELAAQAKKLDPGYANKAVDAIVSIMGDSQTSQQLAPIVRMGASIVDIAYQELSGAGAASSASAGGTSVEGMAMSLATQILDLTDSEIALVGDVAGAVGEAVPIIQAFVSILESVDSMLKQVQNAKIQAEVQGCTTYFRPVMGTGPNIPPKPADIFVTNWTPAVPAKTVTGPTGKSIVLVPPIPPRPIPSSVGAAMIALTECAAAIPVATRLHFRALRHAIEESAKDPARTDGGTQIWPIYIDLLRAEFDNGHLTKPYAMALWFVAMGDGAGAWKGGFDTTSAINDDPQSPAFNPPWWTPDDQFQNADSPWDPAAGNQAALLAYLAKGGKVTDEPMCSLNAGTWTPVPVAQIEADIKSQCSEMQAAACQYHVNCLHIDQRPILGVLQMVDNWRATVAPKWGSDIIALNDEQNFAANALRIAQAKIGGAPLPAPTVVKKAAPVLLLAAPAKTPAIVALFLGAAAIGGAFFVVKTVKKRKVLAGARRTS